MAGWELGRSPAAVPSGDDETRYVVGTQEPGAVGGTRVQVSRTKTCGVTPSNPPEGGVVRRFVASETKAT